MQKSQMHEVELQLATPQRDEMAASATNVAGNAQRRAASAAQEADNATEQGLKRYHTPRKRLIPYSVT
ncbi:hypothetical protein ACT691_16440, partial [Vibrio metschnikovii]